MESHGPSRAATSWTSTKIPMHIQANGEINSRTSVFVFTSRENAACSSRVNLPPKWTFKLLLNERRLLSSRVPLSQEHTGKWTRTHAFRQTKHRNHLFWTASTDYKQRADRAIFSPKWTPVNFLRSLSHEICNRSQDKPRGGLPFLLVVVFPCVQFAAVSSSNLWAIVAGFVPSIVSVCCGRSTSVVGVSFRSPVQFFAKFARSGGALFVIAEQFLLFLRGSIARLDRVLTGFNDDHQIRRKRILSRKISLNSWLRTTKSSRQRSGV